MLRGKNQGICYTSTIYWKTPFILNGIILLQLNSLILFCCRSMQVNRPIVHKRKYFGDNKVWNTCGFAAMVWSYKQLTTLTQIKGLNLKLILRAKRIVLIIMGYIFQIYFCDDLNFHVTSGGTKYLKYWCQLKQYNHKIFRRIII